MVRVHEHRCPLATLTQALCEKPEAFAQRAVRIAPGIARHAARGAGRRRGRGPPDRQRDRDHAARAAHEPLGVTRAGGVRHRETQVPEQPARPPLLDQALGGLVRLGGRDPGNQPVAGAVREQFLEHPGMVARRGASDVVQLDVAARPNARTLRRYAARHAGRPDPRRRRARGTAHRRRAGAGARPWPGARAHALGAPSITSTSGCARALPSCRSRTRSAPTGLASSSSSGRCARGRGRVWRSCVNPGISAAAAATACRPAVDVPAVRRARRASSTARQADYAVLPARNLAPIPDGLGFDEAAAFPLVFSTAWRMLISKARVHPGEWVLVWGVGGGVASAALELCRVVGARAIVTSSSDAELGGRASAAPRRRSTTARDDVADAVRTITRGRGVDVVIRARRQGHLGDVDRRAAQGRQARDHRCHEWRQSPCAACTASSGSSSSPRLHDGERRRVPRGLQPDGDGQGAAGRRQRAAARAGRGGARAGSRRATNSASSCCAISDA